MLKQKHEIRFELQKPIHCICTLNGFALRKDRFNEKFGPHTLKCPEGKAIMGVIYVYLSIMKKTYFFYFKELKCSNYCD